MEEQQDSLFDLKIDDVAQSYLKNTTKWTRFIAVTCLVSLGFLLLFVFFFMSLQDQIMPTFSNSPQLSVYAPGTLRIIIWGACLVGLIYLAIYGILLLRFSNHTARGGDQQNQLSLETGIGSLKTYLMFTGIMGILGALFNLFLLFR